jgi:hypothetical protein
MTDITTDQISKREMIMNLISKADPNHTFTVVFTKKDGSERKMNCRRGVTKYLKGGESTIAHKTNLLGVFDMQEGDYRCFNMDTTKEIRISGSVHHFN